MFLAFVISIMASVVPAILYVLLFYWADRYEREPIWLLSVAFLWGAVPAIVVSVLGEILIGAPFVSEATGFTALLVEGAIVAPIVEELAKGLALLIIYLFIRKEFDGVLDGLVYGALIGFGFAMTENLFYFVGAYQNGGFENLSFVIFLRAVIFGLNHAFYTGLTGIGFGIARTTPGRYAQVIWPIVGLSAAITVHALHNLGASTASVSVWGLIMSLSIAAAGGALIVLAVLLSWQQEKATVRNELANEVGYTLTEQEYAALLAHWHRPIRQKNESIRQRDKRRQQCVELALCKKRLRRLGTEREPQLANYIGSLRGKLREEMLAS